MKKPPSDSRAAGTRMTDRKRYRDWLAVSGLVVPGLAAPFCTFAQVVTDGTVGPVEALSGPNYAVTADLGEIAGANLFHSFGFFSLATGESATFSGPAGLANVISRVTGGERSDIDGLLRSEVPGADFWFLNPAGVMFGPNATLDVPGSFHVSTADELRFADGAVFSATDPVTGSSFTAAAPEAFGYLGAEPAGIVVNESVLEVPVGEALSLVGGPIEIIGGGEGVISAPAGLIILAALGGPGEVQVETGAVTGDVGTDISLSELAAINTSGDGGGTIRIRGGSFVAENSLVLDGNLGPTDSVGGIDLQAEDITLLSGSVLTSTAFDSGRGGSVVLDAEQIEIRDGSVMGAASFGAGNAGTVSIEAEQLTISGGESGFVTGITSSTGSTGDAGEVFVTVDGLLELLNGGVISSNTGGAGNAGSVIVQADQLTISGGQVSFATGIFSDANPGSIGEAGQVFVTVDGLLEVRENGRISSLTRGDGNAGTVTVQAGQLTITGNQSGFLTGISSTAHAGSTGDAGEVSVTVTGLLEVRDNGEISSGTFSAGNAGTVTVQAGQLTITGNQSGFLTGISSTAQPVSTGDAGEVSVTVGGLLEVRDNGEISSGTFSSGNAGTVTVQAGQLTISGNLSGFLTGIASDAEAGSTGNAGQVFVTVGGLLDIGEGGEISSDTSGPGTGGSVTVQADQLTISGGQVSFATGIFSDANPGSIGDAGQVFVTVDGLLEVRENGRISSLTRGDGNAGTVTVQAGQLTITGNQSGFLTGISSTAQEASTGDAGEVSVTVGGLLEVRDNGEISSGTFSAGNAGTVTVQAGQLTITGNQSGFLTGISSTAQPVSTGDAGEVSVTVGGLLEVRDNGEISSGTFSSGNAGTVTVQAGQVTISGDGSDDFLTGIASDAEAGSTGNAGQVVVTVNDELELRNAGTIRSRTRGQGAGGSVSIRAADIFVDNGFIGTDTISEHETADAGTVFIEAGRIEFVNEGRIFNGTGGAGDGGDITVIADTFLADATPLDHDPAFHTGVSASVNTGATGEGGDVIVIARVIRLADGGEISSDTDGLGPGGNVIVIAREELSLTGVAEELDQTGRPARIFASSGDVNADAPAGTVLVAAPVITVADGGQIASSSAGGGEAGTISIGDAAEGSTIEIDRGGETVQIAIPSVDILRLTDASITAETARADAGDILINVNQLVDAVDSEITTSAAGGEGGGGNILISAPRFVVLDDSRIVANAFEGRGGNIDITTDNLFRSPDSVIDASSELGLPGAVTIDAPDVDVTGGLVTLPAGFLDASSLLPESCAARGGEQGGSFVGVGRGGVAPSPETSLPAFYTSPSKTVPASADGASAAWKGDALALFSGGWGLDCDSEG